MSTSNPTKRSLEEDSSDFEPSKRIATHERSLSITMRLSPTPSEQQPAEFRSVPVLFKYTIAFPYDVDSQQCTICGHPYNQTDHIAVRPKVACGHVVGSQCLDKRLRSGAENATCCPSCDGDLKPALTWPPGSAQSNRQPLTGSNVTQVGRKTLRSEGALLVYDPASPDGMAEQRMRDAQARRRIQVGEVSRAEQE